MSKFREVQRLLGDKGVLNFEDWLNYHWNNFVSDFNLNIDNLDFEDNFKSYRTTVDVSDSGVTEISHGLGVVPSSHIVLNGIGGVIRTGTWTNKKAYLTLDSDLYTFKTKSVDVIIFS